MILFQIVAIFFLLYFILLLSYSVIRGAPFAPLGNTRIKTMFELLEVNKGKKFADLGSGDGRIVIEAAKHGLKSYGFEINPLLVLLSTLKLKKLKSSNAKIILSDFWKKDLSEYDYISIYGTKHMLRLLESKLLRELKPGARVVSNHFQFPSWPHKKVKNDVYLYVKHEN